MFSCLIVQLEGNSVMLKQSFLRKMLGTWYGPVGTRFL